MHEEGLEPHALCGARKLLGSGRQKPGGGPPLNYALRDPRRGALQRGGADALRDPRRGKSHDDSADIARRLSPEKARQVTYGSLGLLSVLGAGAGDADVPLVVGNDLPVFATPSLFLAGGP